MKKKMTRRAFVGLSAVGIANIASAATVPLRSNATAPTWSNMNRSGDMIRIAAIQTRRVPECDGLRLNPFSDDFSMDDLHVSIERRISWYEKLFTQAAKEKCNLAVITEDFTRLSQYMTYLDNRAIFTEAVEKQTAQIYERFTRAAKKNGLFIVACYFAQEKDRIYNVADLFGPKGELVGRYRKVHMPQYELWQVTPGDAFPAFETDLGWIGMLICYDQMWPEAASCCAMNGAQIICQPSAAILKDYLMRTRAKDNQVHFISACRNNSMIASPRAEILADGGDRDPAVVRADVSVKSATMSDEYFYEYLYSGIQDHKERHLKFRRPEAYRVLSEQKPPLSNQYAAGGVADTPEAIEKVYQILKEMRLKRMRGEKIPYHWRW